MNNKKIMSKVIASSLVLALGTINAVPVFAYSKDETVYTKANANGSSYQTIVSEHLKNSDNAELLKDMSTLLNIKNTNGDEEASQNGTSLEWKTSGNDIYYQGTSDKELPVGMEISYKLDGKEIYGLPATVKDIERCEPVYEELPGWKEDITHVKSFEELPVNCQKRQNVCNICCNGWNYVR